MLPAVFDFLNGPVRDLVTQIYEAVGLSRGRAVGGHRERDHPDPVRAGAPVRRVPRRRRATPSSRSPGSRGRSGWSCSPARSAPRSGRSSPTRSARGAAGRSSSAGAATSASRAADLDRAEAFFARYGEAASFFGRMMPVIRSLVVVRGRRRPDAARARSSCSRSSARCRSRRCWSSPGVQLGANWESRSARPQALRVRDRSRSLVLVVARPGSGCGIIKPRRAARANA